MQICVAGWDFNKSLYASLSRNQLDTHAVLHKKGDTQGVPFCLIPNEGLEWGIYDYFLKNLWDKKSPVLFMQDDISIVEDSFFTEMLSLTDDFTFIHDSISKCISSERLFSGTGQCFKASSKFLTYLWKNHRGFWYDSKNTGQFDGGEHAGIGVFLQRLKDIQKKKIMVVNNHFYAQDSIIIN